MSSIKFNVSEIVTCTEVEGPHRRLAIWFQGCNLNCVGCFNPELIPLKKANILTLENIIKIITDAKREHDIEGVTFLGGEPTLQQHLDVLCENIQSMNLGVILFSGKLYEELPSTLTRHVDLVIDGPFVLSKLETKRKIIGSTNQRIIAVTERYVDDLIWFYAYEKNQYEINVGTKILITGEAI